MKNTFIIFLLTLTLTFGLYGCGAEVEEAADETVEEATEQVEEAEQAKEESEVEETQQVAAPTQVVAPQVVQDPEPVAAPVRSDAELEQKYQALIKAYNELQTSLGALGSNTKGLNRDAMTDLANKKNQLQSTHGKYVSGGGESLRKIYVNQLDAFETSYWTVKNKYRVE